MPLAVTSKYQNNRGTFWMESLRYADTDDAPLDEITLRGDKADGSQEEFSNSELGFMVMLVEHAKKDPQFKTAVRKVAAELGIFGEDTRQLMQNLRTITAQRELIATLQASLKQAHEALQGLNEVKDHGAITLVKHVKSLNLSEQTASIRKALAAADGPPPGSTGAWA